MATTAETIGFLGDFDDAWVAAIAEALSPGFSVQRLHCPRDIPEEPFGLSPLPHFIVVHRHQLSAGDRSCLKCWKEEGKSDVKPVIFLCVSPYVRYEDTERALCLVDQVIPEGTAADILAGRIARLSGGPTSPDERHSAFSFTIEVSGKNQDLSRTVVEVCRRAGYRALAIDDLLGAEFSNDRRPPAPAPERTLTIWEVPVLESGWPEVLERRVIATGPLIGLLGFADRATVSQAKANGAVACLDLPFEIEDLLDSVARAAFSRAPEHWPIPARLEPPHQLPPRPRRRVASRESTTVTRPWSD